MRGGATAVSWDRSHPRCCIYLSADGDNPRTEEDEEELLVIARDDQARCNTERELLFLDDIPPGTRPAGRGR